MWYGVSQHDVVAVIENLPPHGLVRGQVGTIVEQYAPDAFEVEFVNNSGHTYALVKLRGRQLLVLRYEPAQAA